MSSTRRLNHWPCAFFRKVRSRPHGLPLEDWPHTTVPGGLTLQTGPDRRTSLIDSAASRGEGDIQNIPTASPAEPTGPEREADLTDQAD
jgi:hypothetical protein